MNKNNMVFLKHGTTLISVFIFLIGTESFLLPIYYIYGELTFLIGALFVPLLFSFSALLSKMYFITVEVNNSKIVWKLFGKVVQEVKWEDIEDINIKPKMMNMSIVIQSQKSNVCLYFNGGKSRLKKVLSFCSDEKKRENLSSSIHTK